LRIPHLSFYDHCQFVLKTESPSEDDFWNYQQKGGPFKPEIDTPQYVQENIVGMVVDLYKTEMDEDIFPWLSSSPADSNWTCYINTILALSNSHMISGLFEDLQAFPDNQNAIDAKVSRLIIQEFRAYLMPASPKQRLQPSVTVALLDFLMHCGIISILPDFFRNGKPVRCYVEAPFLRYHFAERLLAMVGNRCAITKSSLLKVAIASEYQLCNPGFKTCFAHTSPDNSGRDEIVLMDIDKKIGYALKPNNVNGCAGFGKISRPPEFRDFRIELLETVDCMNHIYQRGKNSYVGIRS
jgi:hypothetical protein